MGGRNEEITMKDDKIEIELTDEENICPHCGAKMQAYWHKLTPGLVGALVKLRAGVDKSKVNHINPDKDLDGTPHELKKNERSNLSKLRFHGLIAKYKEGGERIQGEWLITRRGFAFLRGEEAVPSKVKTYRNKVVDHDPRLITISEVFGEVPYFERLQDIEVEPGQRSLI